MLRGDLHCHSDWSDGLTSIDLMVDAARALGHEYLALTDHSPRLRVANGLSPERLRDAARGRGGNERRRLHAAVGHRGRHPRRRRARPGARAARRARRRGRLGALEAADGARPDDAAARRARSAIRTSTCWATSPGGSSRDRAARGRRPTFDAQRRVRGLRRERRRRRDQLAPRAAGSARTSSSRSRSTLGCLFSIDSDAQRPGSCR